LRRASPRARAASAAKTTLGARLERLESIEEIRMLAAKYSLSLDMRDLDAHVNLFAPDIRVGRDRIGRAHLRSWVDATLRHQFTGTSHHLGGHIIEFTDASHAHGVVYSKNEHEAGSEWVIMQMLYWDDYERIRGRWYFRRRLPCYWYASDLRQPPLGDHKMRWPGRERYEGSWHELWPSWKQFWANAPRSAGAEVAAPAPLGQFLRTMRRGAPDPKIRVR
jgi:hypothetical protein